MRRDCKANSAFWHGGQSLADAIHRHVEILGGKPTKLHVVQPNDQRPVVRFQLGDKLRGMTLASSFLIAKRFNLCWFDLCVEDMYHPKDWRKRGERKTVREQDDFKKKLTVVTLLPESLTLF